ncbi:MAG: right-handed parallel beta-helix repeat-containing protein [Planctomycetes bacterium]|nr:right-handed parallel beta-helix repeat-containing protein [Planctomycetota bacterium]
MPGRARGRGRTGRRATGRSPRSRAPATRRLSFGVSFLPAFATLARARDEARRRKAAVGGAAIYVRGGPHFLGEPLVLGPQDSGTERGPVVYAAYPGEKPVLSGGRRIAGWECGLQAVAHNPGAGSYGLKPALRTARAGPSDLGKALWTVEIPEVKAGKWYPQQLFVNGERRTRARIPNEGYLLNEGPIEPLTDRKKAMSDPNAKSGFRFKPGDMRHWSNLDDAVVYQFHSWTASLHWIKDLDEMAGVVRFTAPANWPTGYWTKNERYYVENVPEALDAPGEWYLDRGTGVVSYWPLPVEDMRKTEVIAPRLRHLVRIEGDPEAGKLVEHVQFRGLSFQHADWLIKDKGEADGQAAVFLDAAITAKGARHCTFDDCEVAHVGEYAVWLGAGCKDNRVHHCHLRDLGGGGVKLGETASPKGEADAAVRNVVDNCFIHDTGHVFPAGVGVWIGRTSHNVVSHNEICDLNYTGVSVGWSWGYAPSSANHNIVEFNHIHHVGRGVLGDMGGIYTLGISPGTVLRGNVIHDVYSPGIGGGTGIYPDEGSSEILIENNLVYHTEQGCFSQHYGRENIVRNNIWAFSQHGEVTRHRQEEHSSFTFERNIVLSANGQPLAGNWSNGKYAMERNLYWDTSTPDPEFDGLTFEDWQALGRDEASLLADPLFVRSPAFRRSSVGSPAFRRSSLGPSDFLLSPDSPALKLGFVPFDPGRAGLYGEREWVSLPKSIVRKPFTPPPPKPRFPEAIEDGFETTPVAERAAWAVTSGEEGGASIRVTDELAASGKKSLKFTDAPDLKHDWQPHLFYTPRYHRGVARLSFDLRLEPGASFVHEWRDASQPYLVGPSIAIDAKGQLTAGGKPLAAVPSDKWIRVEIAAGLGKQATGTYDMSIAVEGQPPQRFDRLPLGSPAWKSLRWLGFISTAKERAVLYLDNVSLGR